MGIFENNFIEEMTKDQRQHNRETLRHRIETEGEEVAGNTGALKTDQPALTDQKWLIYI